MTMYVKFWHPVENISDNFFLVTVIEAVIAKCINMANACVHDLIVQCSYFPELQPCT